MQKSDYAITTEFIELNQLLKLCGHADSGGAGCMLVATGNVQVDGKQELRKRCKIRVGQVVRLGTIEINVTMADAATIAATVAAKAARPIKPPKPAASAAPGEKAPAKVKIVAARNPFAPRPPKPASKKPASKKPFAKKPFGATPLGKKPIGKKPLGKKPFAASTGKKKA